MTHEQMRNQIDALSFTQLELTLYLDVNPGDETARAMWSKNAARLEEMERQYHAATGKIWPMRHSSHGGSRAWVEEPWPWENRGRNANVGL